MIALPVAMVPPEMKAPPAPPPGGQTGGTFNDHLAAATPSQSGSNTAATTPTSNTAPSSSTVVPWRKLVLKSFAGNNQTAGTTSTAAGAPVAPNGVAALNLATGATNNPANSNTPLAGAAATGNALLSSTALGAGSVQVAAALGTGASIALTAPSAKQSAAGLANAAQNPLGLAPTNASANPAGIPTKGNPAAALNLPANLVGQGQVSPQAATAAAQQSAAANAPGNQPSTTTAAANQTALNAQNLAGNAANPLPLPQTSTAPAGSSPSAAATNAATNANTAQASAANGAAQPVPGALDVSARVVAGAAQLAAQPTTASSAVAAQLLQPHDTNSATTPLTTAEAVPGGKAAPAIGIAAPANGAPTNGTIAAPSASNATSDARSFSAAVDRATAQAQSDASGTGSTTTDSGSSSASGGSAPGAANTAVLAAPTAPVPNSPTQAATDAALRPGMIALPASEQVAINLKQALADGSNEIQIQLKPASLGAIDVKLNVNHDGRLTAVISADRSDTLNLLKHDASSLQQALQNAGFSADSSSLSFNLRSGTQGFAQNGSSSGYGMNQPTGLAEDAPAKLAAYAPRLHNGTIDIQA